MHIIFNLLLLWWLGSELERLWGPRFFTLFYFVSGVGAALIYTGSAIVYALVSKKADAACNPVDSCDRGLIGHFRPFGGLWPRLWREDRLLHVLFPHEI